MCIAGTLWEEAPRDARVAVIKWEGAEYEVPVVEGFFHLPAVGTSGRN